MDIEKEIAEFVKIENINLLFTVSHTGLVMGFDLNKGLITQGQSLKEVVENMQKNYGN
jgi:hypothetical protein